MLGENERERVVRQGTEAWKRLKKDKNWEDWLKVGDALQIGREQAMREAGVNQPMGRGYNEIFGAWLVKNKLDDMDKGDRSRLFAAMDNRAAIEAWRQGLTLSERLRLNHPNAWSCATGKPLPKLDGVRRRRPGRRRPLWHHPSRCWARPSPPSMPSAANCRPGSTNSMPGWKRPPPRRRPT